MKITDYSDTQTYAQASKKQLSELASAALVFIFPALVLLILSL